MLETAIKFLRSPRGCEIRPCYGRKRSENIGIWAGGHGGRIFVQMRSWSEFGALRGRPVTPGSVTVDSWGTRGPHCAQ
jgi:hypothetical protein